MFHGWRIVATGGHAERGDHGARRPNGGDHLRRRLPVDPSPGQSSRRRGSPQVSSRRRPSSGPSIRCPGRASSAGWKATSSRTRSDVLVGTRGPRGRRLGGRLAYPNTPAADGAHRRCFTTTPRREHGDRGAAGTPMPLARLSLRDARPSGGRGRAPDRLLGRREDASRQARPPTGPLDWPRIVINHPDSPTTFREDITRDKGAKSSPAWDGVAAARRGVRRLRGTARR